MKISEQVAIGFALCWLLVLWFKKWLLMSLLLGYFCNAWKHTLFQVESLGKSRFECFMEKFTSKHILEFGARGLLSCCVALSFYEGLVIGNSEVLSLYVYEKGHFNPPTTNYDALFVILTSVVFALCLQVSPKFKSDFSKRRLAAIVKSFPALVVESFLWSVKVHSYLAPAYLFYAFFLWYWPSPRLMALSVFCGFQFAFLLNYWKVVYEVCVNRPLNTLPQNILPVLKSEDSVHIRLLYLELKSKLSDKTFVQRILMDGVEVHDVPVVWKALVDKSVSIVEDQSKRIERELADEKAAELEKVVYAETVSKMIRGEVPFSKAGEEKENHKPKRNSFQQLQQKFLSTKPISDLMEAKIQSLPKNDKNANKKHVSLENQLFGNLRVYAEYFAVFKWLFSPSIDGLTRYVFNDIELTLLVVTTLCSLLAKAPELDSFGLVQKDVPLILEVLVRCLHAVEAFVESPPVAVDQNSNANGKVQKLPLMLKRALETGIKEVLNAHQDTIKWSVFPTKIADRLRKL